MASFIDKLFNSSARDVRELEKKVAPIEALANEMAAKSDDELKAMTPYLKEKLAQGATLDDILPEAYATAREAAKRVIGEYPFHVQLMGGVVLHQGDIAEMKTGEGKTLTSVLPVYLNALAGKGVHVITVNDYLAERDSKWMGQIFRWLGLTVGFNHHGLNPREKRQAYECDITYTTNSELGFDYLRDNMVTRVEDRVLRGLNMALVDEVDSILIDESRTPLIISGGKKDTANYYIQADKFVKRLTEDEDYRIDVQSKSITLTEEGVAKAEKYFNVENLFTPEYTNLVHHINQALKANYTMSNEVEYLVRDGQVYIVDEFTGRIMEGRVFSDGLHQAIEAKEGVKIKQETTTLATITYQNFFRLYNKLCGMTGTAKTEEEEFLSIYNMRVYEIPTNREVIRVDYPDAIFASKKAKYNALMEEVLERHATGQPVLVGTISVDVSEFLSKMFSQRKIKHEVLNAKNHKREADIIAKAGLKGAVTIATNMAGRGTDIKLDDEAKAAGGLKIVGTERHESRRIDNQLRGRSGRQGDPGESKFYISLEDDLMRLFGSERLISIFNALGVPEGQEIAHKSLTKSIESAQKKIENNNFGVRKNVLEYDRVMNEQRQIIYEERRRVLEGESMRGVIYKMITDIVENSVDICINDDMGAEDWNYTELNTLLLPTIPLEPVSLERLKKRKKNDLKQQLKEEAVKLYESKEAEFHEPEAVRELERVILLKVIDRKWMDHIDNMEQMRQGIGLQAYGQKDPLVEYKMAGYEMFDEMTQNIREETVRILLHAKVEQKVEREQVAKVTGTNKDDSVAKAPKMRQSAKVYPNDPCPCGSGKKYKQCHGRKA